MPLSLWNTYVMDNVDTVVGDNDTGVSDDAVVMEHTSNIKDDIDNNQQDADQFKFVNVSKRILQYQNRIRKLSDLSGFMSQTGKLSGTKRTKSLPTFEYLEEIIEKKEILESDEPTQPLKTTLPEPTNDENNNLKKASSEESALPSVKLLSQRFTFKKVSKIIILQSILK